MSDNLPQTLQHLIQDVIAPDVREVKVRVAPVERALESMEKHIDVRFDAFEKQIDARFEAIESRLKSQELLSQAHSKLFWLRFPNQSHRLNLSHFALSHRSASASPF